MYVMAPLRIKRKFVATLVTIFQKLTNLIKNPDIYSEFTTTENNLQDLKIYGFIRKKEKDYKQLDSI